MSNYTNLISELCIPNVLWYQTDITVVMRIMLPGIECYFLRLDEDHVRFSTIIGERNYYLCVYLFGAVIPEKCLHFNKGREVVVYLPKAHRWENWPRLGLDKRINPQIKHDPEKLEDQDGFKRSTQMEFKALMEEYMRQNRIKQILPDGRSSSEEESDDEMMDMLFE